MKRQLVWALSVAFVFTGTGLADTIRHKTKDIVYHGYPKEGMQNGKTVVVTKEKGEIKLDLDDYTIEYNAEGRNNTVAQLYIQGPIMSDLVCDAFIESLKDAAAGGHLLILVEIDSPGGRVDQCTKMAAAVGDVLYTQVYAYINGGEQNGAISAAAVMSLSCDRIYMKPGTCTGAATMLLGDRSVQAASDPDKAAKMVSYWEGTVMSIAEKNGYPPAFARAMITKEVVVLEVMRKGKKIYIEPADKQKGDKVLREINNDKDILTITAKDALEYGFASGNPDSREELLADLGYENVQVVPARKIDKAYKDYAAVTNKVNKMVAKVQQYAQTFEMQMQSNPNAALKTGDKLIRSLKYLVNYAETQKDVPFDAKEITDMLSKYESYYDTLKSSAGSGRRR